MTGTDLGSSALWFLALLSVLFGIISVLVARKYADIELLRRSMKRLAARLYELRLFADDPVVILRSQRDLLKEYSKIFRAILVPCALCAALSLPTLPVLHLMFANAGLAVGNPAVITVQMKNGSFEELSRLRLAARTEIRIDSEGVRAPTAKQVNWRIVPLAASNYELTVENGETSAPLILRVASGDDFLGRTEAFATQSFLNWVKLPWSNEKFARVRVNYPPAVIAGYRWEVWFFLFSCAGTLLAVVSRPVLWNLFSQSR